jgi:vacuolar-type H+-ATPase subunit F/Vma7
MAKAAFVGENEQGNLFRLLGIDVVIAHKEGDINNLKDYELIYAEEPMYQKLKEKYPQKKIVPLVDFKKGVSSVIVYMKEEIKATVGKEVLKDG